MPPLPPDDGRCSQCGQPLDPDQAIAVALSTRRAVRLVSGNRPGLLREIGTDVVSEVLYMHRQCFFHDPEGCA
jgi:hypothetical protein